MTSPFRSPEWRTWFRFDGGRLGGWAPLLAVGLPAVLVYLNSMANGFAYDDLQIVVDNPAVHHPGNLFRIWLTPYWPIPDGAALGIYRPLTIFLFSLQWQVGGGSPLVFHLINILLHAGNSLLVFLLIQRLTDRKSAIAGGLVFAVHPVHVEAVANVVGQAELVSSLFCLATVIVYAGRASEGEISGQRFVLLPILYLLAVLAKENAIVLPGLLFAVDLAQRRHRMPGYLNRALATGVALLGVAGVYLVLRWIVLGGGIAGSASVDIQSLRNPWTRILTALSVWPQYARLLVSPLDLSAMYDPATLPHLNSVTPSVVFGGILLLIVTATALTLYSRPALGLGSFWFLVSVLPVSNLLIPIGTLLAERTLYLPSVALSIWVAYLTRGFRVRSFQVPWVKPAFRVGLVLLILLFSVRAALRNPVWRNNQVLFSTTLRDHPENFRAQWFQALALAEKGDSLASLGHWEKARAIYDGSSIFLTSYARFLYGLGRLDEADRLIQAALDIRRDSPNSLFVQGLVDIARRRPEATVRIRDLRALGFETMAGQLEDRLRSAVSEEGKSEGLR